MCEWPKYHAHAISTILTATCCSIDKLLSPPSLDMKLYFRRATYIGDTNQKPILPIFYIFRSPILAVKLESL